MPPIFASPDIAAIVAAFPPPLPTKGQVTLLRSPSGERLLTSRNVFERLKRLLEANKGRLPVNTLPKNLDIRPEDIPSMLDSCPFRLYYNTDRSQLVPDAEARKTIYDLGNLCRESFVDLVQWSSQRDFNIASLGDGDHQSHVSSDGTRFAFHQSLLDRTKASVAGELARVRPEKCDLSTLLPNHPASILKWIAADLAAIEDLKITVESARDRVILVPKEWQSVQQQRKSDELRARIAALISEVKSAGVVEVPLNDENSSLVRELKDGATLLLDPQYTTFQTNKTFLLVLQSVLDEAIRQLTAGVKAVLHSQWEGKDIEPSSTVSDTPILAAANQAIAASAEYEATTATLIRKLAPILLASPQRTAIVDITAKLTLRDLQAAEASAFATLLQTEILAPMQLYANALQYIPDEALRDRNSALATQILLTEHIRPAMTHLTQRRLLHDRRRAKDTSSFTSTLADAATLDVLDKATQILSKHSTTPTALQLQTQLSQLLTKAAHSLVPGESRDSDVLQNALWILLSRCAQKQGKSAVFVSGGKDTSRMLKVCRTLAAQGEDDDQTVGKLEVFRDQVKAGAARREDVEDICALARATVSGMDVETLSQA